MILFYYIWHGPHGYGKVPNPKISTPESGQGVADIDPNVDYDSPFDISKITAEESEFERQKWGPMHNFHHWGESLFGYYVSDDEWVIRKHCQMISDAGVDAIAFDVTNGYHYRDVYMKILSVFEEIKKNGGKTPKILFNCGISAENNAKSFPRIYEDLYAKKLHSDDWFFLRGKPLILANADLDFVRTRRDFFSVRTSWAWTSQKWFKDGKDTMAWLDSTPQKYGWSESKDKPESVPVSTAEHPHTNKGKSFSAGRAPEKPQSERGIYFAEQWESALKTDPEIIFITQWNEWVAQRFENKKPRYFKNFAGKKNAKEGTELFIDVYNAEYNRDIEPMKGGYGDNYYYQMISGIRRFKGVRPAPDIGDMRSIDIENLDAWRDVLPEYRDDIGDVRHRSHHGWGRVGILENSTGCNDIVLTKVARDEKFMYFYVQTREALTPARGENWMELFIADDNRPADAPNWCGYHYRVALDKKGNYALFECLGAWRWRKLENVLRFAKGKRLALAFSRDGRFFEGNLSLRFKWWDNRQSENIVDALCDGDAAPNARFQYVYKKSQSGKKGG